ncbi:unnamed protein product [Paramecium sonneborni]|uniref:Uncharacterized protein n=1 Tax=Paramecium sonneborni TaxID=65129 RepID=A0A8S1RKJ1_9CILI|nr:unnamed protein product [Paramecium sonneborni]
MKIPLQQQILGMDLKRTPDKDLIINVLKTLKPNKYDMRQFTQEQINKINDLDFSMGKKFGVKRLFRISKVKQIEAEQFKKNIKKKIQKQKWIAKIN